MISKAVIVTESNSLYYLFLCMRQLFSIVARWSRHYLVVTALCSLLFATVYNFAFWRHVGSIYAGNDLSLLFRLLTPIAICALMMVIFTVLFSWRWLLKPVIILLMMINSMASFVAINYGVIFDKDMIRNVFETDPAEASAYLSFTAAAYVIFLGVLPSVILWRTRIIWPESILRGLAGRVAFSGAALAMAVAIVLPNYQTYSFIGRNNPGIAKEIMPVSYIVSTVKYVKSTWFPKTYEYIHVGEDAVIASTSQRPRLMVFVVGETARAQNYPENGYSRDTTPYTSGKGLINFSDVSSCATSTALSVPCMFSNLTRNDFSPDIAEYRDNVIDVLTQAGVQATWIDNNSSCKGVCKNITYKELGNTDGCDSDKCRDEVMIPMVEKLAQDVTKDTVIFLHLIGSHGPRYYERYPERFRKFTPDCSRPDVENCNLADLINTYDNTIVYTDWVLSSLTEVLKRHEDDADPMLFYISDHGESLGEKGLFLHGAPYMIAPDYQTRVPMQMWLSENVRSTQNLDSNCLVSRAARQALSHDNVFHTLLGLMQVKTEAYDARMDALSICRDVTAVKGNTDPAVSSATPAPGSTPAYVKSPSMQGKDQRSAAHDAA